jgi:hypothetical protein
VSNLFPGWLPRGGAQLVIGVAVLLAAASAFAQVSNTPVIRIAVVGNPVHAVEWTDDNLEKLKSIGFTEVQLNMAWGPRPFDEPLNLADVVTAPGEVELPGTLGRRAEIKRRLLLAKRHGLRALFSFASPYANFDPNSGFVTRGPRILDDVTYDSWYDILNPKVRDHEVALLRTFRREFPEVDDILVYTYDNDSWQTPEFQFDRFSYGIPLSDRLPGYLEALHAVWCEGRADRVRMWWEPWELSAGQVYAMLPKLPRAGFGLIIHANIAEAQLVAPVDVWFRNTARMSYDLGIPVVAESFFASASEELEPLAIPAPRLVDEEYTAFLSVPGVVGIKEYYGIDVTAEDLDIDLLQARIKEPSRSTDQLLNEITRRFGPAQPDVREYLSLLSEALQIYPWDASWFARDVGKASADHGWKGATIQGATWSTPAWQATRHAKFMKTDSAQPHFWMLEDVQLRCSLSADILQKAAGVYARLSDELPNAADRAQFRRIHDDADTFRRISRSYALHLRETNIAQMLRQDLDAKRPMTAALVKELRQLLDSDVDNQNGAGRVVEMRRLFLVNPGEFLRRYLIPTDEVSYEKGYFTLTTR